jgi:hypothetical protein
MDVHNMFMSNQNILIITHTFVLSAQRGFFVQFLSSCAGNLFPHIQLLHHKGIVSIQAFTKIWVMSVHNMFMSDHIYPYERSKAFL